MPVYDALAQTQRPVLLQATQTSTRGSVTTMTALPLSNSTGIVPQDRHSPRLHSPWLLGSVSGTGPSDAFSKPSKLAD